MSVVGKNARGNPNVALATCSTSDSSQRWQMDAATGALKNPANSGMCMDIQQGKYEIELYACAAGHAKNQDFIFSAADGRLTVADGARKGLAVAVC